MFAKLAQKAFKHSLWIYHCNSGACNGCDIEVVDSLTPRFDIERFGLLLQGTPRHADVLVCTGAVTLQTRDRLKRIYEQMPDPKFVIAVGSCACSGGIFDGCYCVAGGIDSVIPVDVYVPGCAARPEAIIDAVVKLLTALENSQKAITPAPVEEKTVDAEPVEAIENAVTEAAAATAAVGQTADSATTSVTDQSAAVKQGGEEIK